MGWFSEQAQERRRLDQEELEDSYARLAASVVDSRRTPRFTLDDAIAADDAVSAILAFFGQTPAEISEDITDPAERIECTIRPTGVMKRPVRLDGTWWRDATGVYLGKLKDGGPVAIIPTKARGYGFIDPATKEKVDINKKTAGALEPEALRF